jgi:23S rRNA G2069 N7-methylase RlmK/C1962 C5-methylase RlmI
VVLARYARNDEDLRGPGWLPEMAAAAASALGVGAADLFVKERRRQRGLAQYERVDERNARFTVTEGGHRFWVNLSDYLDTGLFLDHRPTRAMVGAAAAGKRFLNLFSYTAAFTVHAARGGAERSVSVDLSRTYTDWAAANFALNEIDPGRHALIAADVDRWLDEARREGQRFDLAFVDPPTFSNSKRMQGVFDIERDHVDLLRATAALLAPGGVIYFSTNHRRFHLDEESLSQASLEVEDISARTIPPDYRDQKVHRCWILRRR